MYVKKRGFKTLDEFVSWKCQFVGSCEYGNEFSRSIKGRGIPWLVQWLSPSQEEVCSCLMKGEAWKLNCLGTSASAVSRYSSTSSRLAPQFVSHCCLFSRTRSANTYLEKTPNNLDGISLHRKGSLYLLRATQKQTYLSWDTLTKIPVFNPSKPRWLLYIPHSLTYQNSAFSPQNVFECLLWFSW